MLTITIRDALYFDGEKLPRGVFRKIKRHFRTLDPKYYKDRKRGTLDDDQTKFLNLFNKYDDGTLSIPRGCSSYLTEILDENEIEYKIVDERLELDTLDIPDMKFKLRKYQKKASNRAVLVSQGVIKAPCGAGKTIIGVDIISRVKQPALIIVPDTELMYQWVERLQEALGMHEDDIGLIGDGWDIVCDVTIGTTQSLVKRVSDPVFCQQFGLVMMDESHMVAARTFREVMSAFPAKYKFGLTATPYRNDNLTDLIQYYCGKLFYEITDEDLDNEGLLIKPELVVRETNFKIQYNRRDAQMNNKFLKAMAENNKRNEMICKDLLFEFKKKRLSLVVAKRGDHCKEIKRMLESMNPKIRVADMSGTEYDVEAAELAREGKIDVIVSVNRALQGLDIKNLENLFMVAPRRARGEIEQIVGRIQRPSDCGGRYKDPTDKIARIYDYYDCKMDVGAKGPFEDRMKVYQEKCSMMP